MVLQRSRCILNLHQNSKGDIPHSAQSNLTLDHLDTWLYAECGSAPCVDHLQHHYIASVSFDFISKKHPPTNLNRIHGEENSFCGSAPCFDHLQHHYTEVLLHGHGNICPVLTMPAIEWLPFLLSSLVQPLVGTPAPVVTLRVIPRHLNFAKSPCSLWTSEKPF